MNHEQMSRVLAKCALFDARTFGDSEVRAWHETAGELDFADAMQAVPRYYAASRQRMWPADLRQTVAAIATERAAAITRADQEQP